MLLSPCNRPGRWLIHGRWLLAKSLANYFLEREH
jgi:hypothetical protein